jgi:hypothetical protein
MKRQEKYCLIEPILKVLLIFNPEIICTAMIFIKKIILKTIKALTIFKKKDILECKKYSCQ